MHLITMQDQDYDEDELTGEFVARAIQSFAEQVLCDREAYVKVNISMLISF